MMREETIAASRHVWQVAELVRRLDQGEIRELIRLVPRLQREVTGERGGLVQWALSRWPNTQTKSALCKGRTLSSAIRRWKRTSLCRRQNGNASGMSYVLRLLKLAGNAR